MSYYVIQRTYDVGTTELTQPGQTASPHVRRKSVLPGM